MNLALFELVLRALAGRARRAARFLKSPRYALAPATLGTLGAVFGIGLMLTADLGTRLAVALGTARGGGEIVPADWASAVPLGKVLAIAAALVPLAAAVASLVAALQQAALLAFPGWFRLGPHGPQTASALGQNLIGGLALILALTIGLIPGALAVGLILLAEYLAGFALSTWQYPLLAALAALPVFFEAGLLVVAGGRLWAKLDASREALGAEA